MNILRGIFSLALVILGAAACTSRSDANLLPIRIAYPSSGTIINAQVGLIFEKTDLLRTHGLKGEMHAMNTGREMKVALVSGAVDVILTSEANFVVLLGEGFDARAVGTLGSAGKLALVVAQDSKVNDLKELKGKSIGTMVGTSLHEPALRWAKEAGGAQIVSMTQIGGMMAALKSGQTDAIVTWDPFLEDGIQKKEIRKIRDEDFELITVARGDFVTKNPRALGLLNEAFRDAIVYLAQNKAQVNSWFARMSGMGADVIDKASAANRNYGIRNASEISLTISDAYVKKLENTADFFRREKVLRMKPEIRAHLLQ